MLSRYEHIEDIPDGVSAWDVKVRSAASLARTLAEKGVRWFAVTAIARDGQMSGPDYELLESVRAAVPDAAIIASAGVSSLDDVRELVREEPLSGCVPGPIEARAEDDVLRGLGDVSGGVDHGGRIARPRGDGRDADLAAEP